MSEIKNKVACFAADMFKHVIIGKSDDPQTLARAAAQLGKREFENYLITCPHEFLCDRDFIIELWHEQDPVRFLLSRKTLDSDVLPNLAAGVTGFLDLDVPYLDECATAYLERMFNRTRRFNPAEVGYLWRLIHDCEFPVMPATHGMQHDSIANRASMGDTPEEVVELAQILQGLDRGE